MVTFFLRLGLTLIVLALAVGLYRAAIDIHADRISPYILLWVFLSLALAAKADFNFVSVHRYYADRLCLAYLGAPQSQEDASDFAIKNVNVRESGAPYPIINCTVLTPHSTDDDTRYRLRRGDNFIFSPLYFGANCTGYGNNKLGYRLSTAMAVSGAAIDPHTGEATTWELRFLMSLLNVRVGYWILHPIHFETYRPPGEFFRDYVKASWAWLLSSEMFYGLTEDTDHLRLSDGCHFENLGLYELVRRKCALIIVSDAGEDRHSQFGDLARAIERVRVDFGAEIEIDLALLKPDANTAFSDQPFAIGSITYLDKTTGTIIYLKATLFSNLPADILGYRSANKAFPNETSLDQFFDEEQFEAYRELGYQSGKRLFCSKLWRNVLDLTDP